MKRLIAVVLIVLVATQVAAVLAHEGHEHTIMGTVAAAFMGLLPIMWSTSAGADVMKRIAAPMIGGLATSFILELLVYPAVFKLWKKRTGLPIVGAEGTPAMVTG